MSVRYNKSPDKESVPNVCIVILNWNNYEDTSQCLESLEKCTYNSLDVLVVDNASTDGSFERLKQEFDWCSFIQNKQNQGFASGCNSGIEKALSMGCDYVLLLNNDTIVDDDFLEPLVETAESNIRVAAVGGIIYHPDGEKIWFAGGHIKRHFAKISVDTSIQSDKEYETEYIIGTMMLISSDFLRSQGYFNSDYFFGSEDQDLCVRAQDAGWKLMINPNSEIIHKINAKSGSQNGFQLYHNTYNRLHFSRDVLKNSEKAVFYPYFLVNRFLLICLLLSKGNFSAIQGIILALVDYLLGDQRKALEYV